MANKGGILFLFTVFCLAVLGIGRFIMEDPVPQDVIAPTASAAPTEKPDSLSRDEEPEDLPTGETYSRQERPGDIPQEIWELKLINPELSGFVDEYPVYAGADMPIDLTREARSIRPPLLLQWDKRWGYKTYGSGLMGYTGCGPTCLSMVVLYLTGDASADPWTVAQYSERNGHYAEGYGTSWSLMLDGCLDFGVQATILPLGEDVICEALDDNQPVILALGPGDFTSKGHFIVLTGYDEDGFTVNDPNSPEKSGQHWTFETLEGQIRNIWAYTLLD